MVLILSKLLIIDVTIFAEIFAISKVDVYYIIRTC